MPRSLPIPYAPNPVPSQLEDVPRYLYDELTRIKEALVAEPVAFAISDDTSEPIGPTINWQILFDDGQSPNWEFPGGEYDPATGRWTCPKGGLHSVDLQMEISAFGSGNKNYYGGLRVHVERDGLIIDTFESTDGGDDDIPLGVTLTGMIPLLQGDVVYCEATIVHENQTGLVDVSLGWQILWLA